MGTEAELVASAPRRARAGLGVFVLGMHRSGTSAVTRMVNLLGMPLCVENDLMLGFPDNPPGHWESKSLADFNERLLRLLNAAWDCPPPTQEGPLTDLRLLSEVAPAHSAFRAVHRTAQWAWKDPRLCVLLPFWRVAVPGHHAAILVLRHPAEGAASLVRRDRLQSRHALAIWERYMRLALIGCEELPTLVLEYDDLIADPSGTSHALRRFLDDCGAELISDEAAACASVHPQLRHHVAHAPSSDGLTEMQRSLLSLMCDLKGAHRSFGQVELPPESPYVTRFVDWLRRSRGYAPPITTTG